MTPTNTHKHTLNTFMPKQKDNNNNITINNESSIYEQIIEIVRAKTADKVGMF